MIRQILFYLCLCCVFASLSYALDTPKIFTKDNVLAAGCYNNGFSSSDMTLIIQLTVRKDVIFDEGVEVKYHVPDKDVEGWTELEFDDKNWKKDITGIGYSDGDDNTEIKSGEVGSLYTRYKFDVPKATTSKKIMFRIDYDDSYILWLNGVEIGRSANIATLSPVGEIPTWDVSKIVGSMPGAEATRVPKGKPNKDRWDRDVTPRERDVSETIHEFEINVKFGGGSALSVEAANKLTTVWARLKGYSD